MIADAGEVIFLERPQQASDLGAELDALESDLAPFSAASADVRQRLRLYRALQRNLAELEPELSPRAAPSPASVRPSPAV